MLLFHVKHWLSIFVSFDFQTSLITFKIEKKNLHQSNNTREIDIFISYLFKIFLRNGDISVKQKLNILLSWLIRRFVLAQCRLNYNQKLLINDWVCTHSLDNHFKILFYLIVEQYNKRV
jgi:hypothetical protein